MMEHESLAQDDGVQATHSGWQSTFHLLRMIEHELLALNDVALKASAVSERFFQNDVRHSAVPLSTIGNSASGLSTLESTPMKWLIRNGWSNCGCIPYTIHLTLKTVFTSYTTVDEMK